MYERVKRNRSGDIVADLQKRYGHASLAAEMRAAMAAAEVGDDVYGEDPTVERGSKPRRRSGSARRRGCSRPAAPRPTCSAFWPNALGARRRCWARAIIFTIMRPAASRCWAASRFPRWRRRRTGRLRRRLCGRRLSRTTRISRCLGSCAWRTAFTAGCRRLRR